MAVWLGLMIVRRCELSVDLNASVALRCVALR